MTRTILALTALAIAGTIGLAALAGNGAAAPLPSTPPSSPAPSPVVTPRPTTAPVVTPAPTRPPTDAMPIRVDLENATNHDVYIDIVDKSRRIVRATSGTPAEGASVPPYELRIEQIDARTLRVTWSDLGGDNALALYLDETGTGWILVQPEHEGPVDLMPLDRVLVLEFADDISAADVRATLQDGLDT